jgi:hypothetical protein
LPISTLPNSSTRARVQALRLALDNNVLARYHVREDEGRATRAQHDP